jgi:hypothetical protein
LKNKKFGGISYKNKNVAERSFRELSRLGYKKIKLIQRNDKWVIEKGKDAITKQVKTSTWAI